MSDNPIVGWDIKKKELLGTLFRDVQVFTETPLETPDHDYALLISLYSGERSFRNRL